MLTYKAPSATTLTGTETSEGDPSPRTRSSLIGIWCLVLTLGILAQSLQCLRGDDRFRASASLSTAAKLILSESMVPVEPEAVFHGAAQGMISVLDPYSSYLSPQDFELFNEESEGEYVGIGIEVRVVDGVVTLSDVYPQSPAADALLRPGDRITTIDGASTRSLNFAAVVEKLRGEAGTPVGLEIERSGAPRREVRLIRRAVAIEAFPISGVSRSGVAYVRWSYFSAGSADRLAAIVEELVVDEPIGLILDLRGNPGGVLDEATAAAGLFLPPNSEVCTLVDAQGQRTPYFTTSSLPPDFVGPLIIVQDELSASSAEVLIAALRDGGRAVTIGRRSFGKGWVQNIFPLDSLGAIRLSVARYETPSGAMLGDPVKAREQYDSIYAGAPWSGAGLEPDVKIPASSAGTSGNMISDVATLAEFVVTYADEWPAVGAEDSAALLGELHGWLEGRNLESPSCLGDSLLLSLKEKSRGSELPAEWANCAELLEEALQEESDLVRRRDEPQILRHLWERRLLYAERPDPGEVEALLDLDPDLAAARDLLEQPERYQILRNRPPNPEKVSVSGR